MGTERPTPNAQVLAPGNKAATTILLLGRVFNDTTSLLHKQR
jgi:hypothetical protein